MQFMVVYHPGPEGLALNPPLRWQHGPTPGVKLLGGWVSTAAAPTPADQRTFIAIEADSIQAVNGFVGWMRPFARGIEVLPVTDYLPTLKAYEARDPEQAVIANPNLSPEQVQQQRALQRRFMAAKTPAEALEIWRNTAGPGGGKDTLDALRIRQELDQV